MAPWKLSSRTPPFLLQKLFLFFHNPARSDTFIRTELKDVYSAAVAAQIQFLALEILEEVLLQQATINTAQLNAHLFLQWLIEAQHEATFSWVREQAQRTILEDRFSSIWILAVKYGCHAATELLTVIVGTGRIGNGSQVAHQANIVYVPTFTTTYTVGAETEA